MFERQVTVSIVSHGHRILLDALISDLAAFPEVAQVVLTYNVPEPDVQYVDGQTLLTLRNSRPKGFGENHNRAFEHARTPYFAVLNPDLRLPENPFPRLLQCLQERDAALVAPAVVGLSGAIEDSAREFPALADLARKAFGAYDGRLHYRVGDAAREVPWVAGMFMLFRCRDFDALNGFDERFFLYYEDVDLCARAWSVGRSVVLCPSTHVVHDARRASRRNVRHMLWHARSMARYFRKHWRYAMRRSIE